MLPHLLYTVADDIKSIYNCCVLIKHNYGNSNYLKPGYVQNNTKIIEKVPIFFIYYVMMLQNNSNCSLLKVYYIKGILKYINM